MKKARCFFGSEPFFRQSPDDQPKQVRAEVVEATK